MHRCRSEGPLPAATEDLFLVSPSKRRIRDIIEMNRAVNQKLDEQARVEEIAQRARYYTRWKHLRDVYAMSKQCIPAARSPTRRNTPSSPTRHQAGTPRQRNHGGPLLVACIELCVEPLVPVLVMASIMFSALALDAQDPTAQTLVMSFLKCMQLPHPCKQPGSFFVDHRVICCMWDILDHPTFPPLRRLTRWFDTFCTASPSSSESVVRAQDIRPMLLAACPTPATEAQMDVFVKELVSSLKDSDLHLARLLAYADTRFDLHILVRRLCWENLTESQRDSIEKDEHDMTAAFVERERQAAQHAKALAYWIHMEPRRRFVRWKQFTEESVRLKKADRHAARYKCGRGLTYLERNARRVRWLKRSVQKAIECYNHTLAVGAWEGWVAFWAGCRELDGLATRQGRLQYEAARRRSAWTMLVNHTIAQRLAKQVLLQRTMQLMQQTTDKLLAKMVAAWRYFVELQKLDRMSQQRQEDMVAAAAEFERYQHECLCMDREDALAMQMRLDEGAEVERARKAMFREQARQVFEVRKIKQQEETRTLLKKKREEAQAKLAEAAWTDIEQMAVTKARDAAEDWLRSPQGQTELQAAATYIYEDPPTSVSKMLQQDPTYSNVPDCVWVCRLENIGGRHAKAYFYHTERLEKVLCDELTMKASLAIASEQLVQRRINTMKVQLAQRGEEERVKFMRNAAAKRIQMLFRCRQAKKYVRSLLRPLVMKRIDAATGRVVYFNIQERKTAHVPPRLMGSAEATLPVESTTWVRRLDGDSGDQYYMDLTTGETSWAPPNAYVMCTKCKINFCTSRNTATGERFCVSCYAELAQLQRQADKAARAAGKEDADAKATKTWTRIAVVPAKCCVCKVNNGEMLCHECHGDTTCSRCFATLHRNPKLKHHAKHESLVYTQTG